MKVRRVLGASLVTSLLSSAGIAAATDGVPYQFSCSLGSPIVIHGHVPTTVAAGEPFQLTDVHVQYTSPVPASYTGTRITIPVPQGATGSDLVIENPETVNLDSFETTVSPPVAATFVASGDPGAVIAFRPTTLHVDSASTVSGGPLDCTFTPGQPAFATTTIAAPAARPVAATPAFTG